MFSPKTATGATPLVLELRGIQVPPTKARKDAVRKTDKPLPPNCHVPSFKNSKMLITKVPQGKGRPMRLLEKPFLITKPEFQQWMEKAIQSLISQLLSMSRTVQGETQSERSKLFAMLSCMPADDSVNDLPVGSWKVMRCQPGEEGARIEIRRIR